MKKTLALFLVTPALFAAEARAESCADLKTCAKLMYDLEGQRYIWDAKMDEYKFVASPDVQITKDTADLVFTALLDQLGLARVPVGDGKTFRVMRVNIRRDMDMPILEASADREPAFPSATWDWVTIRYKVRSPETAPYIETAYRQHVPRESSLNSDENAGVVIITAPIPVAKQLYETIRESDRPLSASVKQRRKEAERLHLQAKFGAASGVPFKN